MEEEEEEEDLVCSEIQLERRRRQEEDSLAEEEEALVVDYLAPPLMPVEINNNNNNKIKVAASLEEDNNNKRHPRCLAIDLCLSAARNHRINKDSQVQQQHNAFYNVPESITTQAQGGPTLFHATMPPEALLRARQQRHIASQPPANGTTLEPVKELQDVMNWYNPQHPDYRFKAFFYNIAQDPRQKVKIQNIDERTWHELLDKVGGEENENGLWLSS